MAVNPEIFDNATTATSLLGSWWSRTYEGREQVAALVAAKLSLARQQLTSLQEFEQSLSRQTVPIYHRQLWYPLTLRKSHQNTSSSVYPRYDGSIHYDDSWRYDRPRQQPGYAFTAPPNLRHAPVIVNHFDNPTLVLSYDTGFTIRDATIVFRDNLFEDPRVELSNVYDGNELVDVETTLWIYRGDFDTDLLHQQFGYVVGLDVPSSPAGRDLLNAIYDSLVGGTSAATTQAAICAVTSVKAAAEDETILDVVQTATALTIITDKHAYSYHPDDSAVVTVGQHVRRGQLLTSAVRLTSFNTGQVPADVRALTFGRGLLAPCMLYELTFVNQEVPLLVNTDHPSGFTYVKWEMSGFPADVQKFFDLMHERGVAASQKPFDACNTSIPTITYPNDDDPTAAVTLQCGTLAHFLDRRTQRVGEPTASHLPNTINPLELIAQTVLRNNTSLVTIDVQQLPTSRLGLHNLQFLHRTVNPEAITLILLDLTATTTSVTVEHVGQAVSTFTGAAPIEIGAAADSVTVCRPIARIVSESCQ